jgi:formimidoylglutamate deiminase
VHATHLDDDEVERLAKSGAVAGLCPTTEGDLGDGFFRLGDHLEAGGRFGVGSDSNVGTVAAAELRLLEYGQRLSTLRRLVAANETITSCAGRLWRGAVYGGAQASGRPVGHLAPGHRADLLVLDGSLPDLAETTADDWLDALVFGPLVGAVRDVMVGGHWRVQEGHHAAERRVAEAYRHALRRLVR